MNVWLFALAVVLVVGLALAALHVEGFVAAVIGFVVAVVAVSFYKRKWGDA